MSLHSKRKGNPRDQVESAINTLTHDIAWFNGIAIQNENLYFFDDTTEGGSMGWSVGSVALLFQTKNSKWLIISSHAALNLQTQNSGTLTVKSDGSLILNSGGMSARTVGDCITVNQLPRRKTGDWNITSSTTLANDTHLVQAIAASEGWYFDFNLVVYCADAGVDLKYAITVPAGATVYYGTTVEVAGGASAIDQYTNTSGTAKTVDIAAGEYKIIHIKCIVENSTNAGDVQLQCAQNASSATALTIKENSYVMGWRIV